MLLVLCHYVERRSTTYTRNTSSSLRAAAIYFSRRSLRESYRQANQRISLKEGGCPHGLLRLLGWPGNNFEANLRMQDDVAVTETCFAQYQFHSIEGTWRWKCTYVDNLVDKRKPGKSWAVLNIWARTETVMPHRVAPHWFLPNRKLLPASFGWACKVRLVNRFNIPLAISINMLHVVGPRNCCKLGFVAWYGTISP